MSATADILTIENDLRCSLLDADQQAAVKSTLAKVLHAARFDDDSRTITRPPGYLERELFRASIITKISAGLPINADHIAAWQKYGRAAVIEEAADRIRARKAAERLVASEGDSDDEDGATPDRPGASWTALDLGPMLDAAAAGQLEPPQPTVGHVDCGGALLYAGEVNGIAGPPGEGKSQFTRAVMAQELENGSAVLLLDFEDGPEATVASLLAIGVAPTAIAHGLHYIQPSEAFAPAARAELLALIEEAQPTLAVIDSTGEALALEGADPNSDDDVARWFRTLPRAIARRGPCVVLVDHVAKAEDNRRGPIGSQRKLAAITGAQYTLKAVRAFARGQAGHAALTVVKDRHGARRVGSRAAELHVTPGLDGTYRLTLRPVAADSGEGHSGTFRPTALMERTSRVLEEAGEPISQDRLRATVGGNKKAADQAVFMLEAEGFVRIERGARGAKLHHHVNPYRQASDPASDSYQGSSPDLARPRPGRPESPDQPPRPSPPAYRRGEEARSKVEHGNRSQQPHLAPVAPALCRDCGRIIPTGTPSVDGHHITCAPEGGTK